ncbi:ATP-binding protein [Bacteroidales bacterium OttesenSCG-928-B11]|nr:ATP-binding protein [Bacteroidales bacterium OttesenSCG-928-E04]MDL2308145.1 ATP-binding protein [Bacteroidales bacterium OttesenSCG-928-C03]MDL2311500.1 ATP-binding protein [Bacteroidales bacterium OttesenSCG-928-B11]MDL2325571.1 ATP-binding protein [Bacteroidales bacterium OttesenSCG-928-A14]
MKNLIERTEYLDKLWSYKDKDIIKVVTGLRRSGKSTLLELFRNHLLKNNVMPEQIQLYNFELPENFLNKTWETLYFEIKSKLQTDKSNYIFLDEIQNIANFEKLVDGLYATENTDVYITGSNANLLSSELATLLSGRYIEVSILPFSFAEYLEARSIDISNKYLNYEALFYDYVNETSLPKGVDLREEGFDKIYEYLEALYTTIIEKDITQRYKINDKRAFGNVAKFLAGNIGNQVSPSSISKALKADNQNIHHATVEKFIGYLVESFVFYCVNRFDVKGKKQLATQEKYYLVDLGLLNILLGREKTADRGHILENIVYLELLRRGCKIWTGALRNSEIDFVVKNRIGEIEYYQVSWEISSTETEEREFSPLKKVKDNYPKFLLTTESFPQSRDGIIHRNVFEWLLEK